MNWINFFRDYNIPYKQKESGKVVCNCPIHAPKDIDNFLLLFNTGGSCWFCGKHSAFELVTAFVGSSITETYTILKAYEDGKSYYTAPKLAPPKAISLPLKQFNRVEQAFLQQRNIDTLVDKYDLRGGGVHSYFSYRIVIPIYKDGVIVSARGRSIANTKLKYLALDPSLEIIPHKHTLFNEDNTIGDTIVVVEGEIDAMRFGDGCVATYGTQITEPQVIALSKYKNIILLLDNDDAGKRAVDRIGNDIATLTGREISSILLPSPYKDVGDVPTELIHELRKDIYYG